MTEIEQLKNALTSSQACVELYRARWLSCVTQEEAKWLRDEIECLRMDAKEFENDPLRGVSRALRDDMVLQADLTPDGRLVCTIDRNLWNAWAEAIGDLAAARTTKHTAS